LFQDLGKKFLKVIDFLELHPGRLTAGTYSHHPLERKMV